MDQNDREYLCKCIGYIGAFWTITSIKEDDLN